MNSTNAATPDTSAHETEGKPTITVDGKKLPIFVSKYKDVEVREYSYLDHKMVPV